MVYNYRSSGCRSHVNLMKEDQKCTEEQLLLNLHEATNDFSKEMRNFLIHSARNRGRGSKLRCNFID